MAEFPWHQVPDVYIVDVDNIAEPYWQMMVLATSLLLCGVERA